MTNHDEPSHRHHFIPKLLLKGFTMSGRPGDVLWRFDRTRARPIRKQAAAEGWGWDFYRVDSPVFGSVIYERVFQAIEGPSARILDGVRATETLPSDEQLASLISFIALTYIRSPVARKVLSAYYGYVEELATCPAVPSPQAWTWLEEMFGRREMPRLAGPKFVLTKHLMTGGDLDFRTANAAAIHTATVFSFLFRFAHDMYGLRWGLLVSDDEANFVASDSPCSRLSPHVDTDQPPLPSVLAPEIEVALPISRKLALVGSRDETAAKRLADEALVADINFRTMVSADRFVYAPQDDFVFLIPGDRVSRAAERWDQTRKSLGQVDLIDDVVRAAEKLIENLRASDQTTPPRDEGLPHAEVV